MASQNNQASSDQSNSLAEVVKQMQQTLAQLEHSLQKERERKVTLAQQMAQLKQTHAALTTENNTLKTTKQQTSSNPPSLETASTVSAASLPTHGAISVNNKVEPNALSSQPPSSKSQLTYHSTYTSTLSKQREDSTGYCNLFQKPVKREQIKVTEEFNYTCSSFNEVQGQFRSIKTQNAAGQDAQKFCVHNENNRDVLGSDHQIIQTIRSLSINHIMYGSNISYTANNHFNNQHHSVGTVDKQPLWENCAVATNRLEACNLNHYTQLACN